MADPRSAQPYPEYPKVSNEGYGAPPVYNLSGPNVQYYQPPNTQQMSQIQYVQPVGIVLDPSVAFINDWLAWSIVNLFIGWLFAGILPLIFSLVCRSYKQSNNASGARTMSTLALVFNILITLGGIAGWIALIVVLVAYRSVCDLYYPYC